MTVPIYEVIILILITTFCGIICGLIIGLKIGTIHAFQYFYQKMEDVVDYDYLPDKYKNLMKREDNKK